MKSRNIHEEYIQWVELNTPYSENKDLRISGLKKIINVRREVIIIPDDNDIWLTYPPLNDYLKVADNYEVWCKKNHVKPIKKVKGYIPSKHTPRPNKKEEKLYKCYFCGEYLPSLDVYIEDRDRHFLNGDYDRAMITESPEQRRYVYNFRFLNAKFRTCDDVNPEYKAEFMLKGGKRMEKEWLDRLNGMTPEEFVGYHRIKRVK